MKTIPLPFADAIAAMQAEIDVAVFRAMQKPWRCERRDRQRKPAAKRHGRERE